MAKRATVAGFTAFSLFAAYVLLNPKNQLMPNRKVSMSQGGAPTYLKSKDFDHFNQSKGQWLQ